MLQKNVSLSRVFSLRNEQPRLLLGLPIVYPNRTGVKFQGVYDSESLRVLGFVHHWPAEVQLGNKS
jgi:hypothetical protein